MEVVRHPITILTPEIMKITSEQLAKRGRQRVHPQVSKRESNPRLLAMS